MKRLAVARGLGPPLFLLPVLALCALALAEGGLHFRVQYLLEPAAGACAHPDLASRSAVVMAMVERGRALQPWLELRWIPIAGVLLALLAAVLAGVSAVRHAAGRVRRVAIAYVLLHAGALGLAGWALYRAETAWARVVKLAPVVCALDPANPDVPIAQVPQQAFALFMGSSAGLLHNPGRLAMVLAATLLVALVMGVWLWRGERR